MRSSNSGLARLRLALGALHPCGRAADYQLTGGGAVASLEQRLRELYSVRHALCVSSATSGLLAVALALELKNAEIIAPALGYGATLSSFLLLGNRIRFADVDPVTLTVDPDSVARLIGPRTRAIIAVDLFGVPADTAALRKVADEHGLLLLTDAAQSFGATREGKPITGADAIVLSFATGKTLFAGEGGAVLTDRADIYERLVWHSQHPYRQRRDLGFSLENEFALNCRIHPLAASWANASFEHSLRVLRRRQRKCFRFTGLLNQSGLIEHLPFSADGVAPTFFRLSVARRKSVPTRRLVDFLSRSGSALSRDERTMQIIPKIAAFRSVGPRAKSSGTWAVAERQIKRRIQFIV